MPNVIYMLQPKESSKRWRQKLHFCWKKQTDKHFNDSFNFKTNKLSNAIFFYQLCNNLNWFDSVVRTETYKKSHKKSLIFSQKLHSSTQTSSRYAENFYFLQKNTKKKLLICNFFLLLYAELCVMCVLSWSNFFFFSLFTLICLLFIREYVPDIYTTQCWVFPKMSRRQIHELLKLVSFCSF